MLRGKLVLLFIKDLEITYEELQKLIEAMYTVKQVEPTLPKNRFKIVWIPVVDKSTPWNEEKQRQFETLQMEMSCYSMYHPSQLDSVVIIHIKEMWHFTKKPLLVVLAPQGEVVNLNAFHIYDMDLANYGIPFH